jgi:hypothetical protein
MDTPLVGFDTGGVSEGVKHVVTGLLSPRRIPSNGQKIY